jgi:hypothetical protein
MITTFLSIVLSFMPIVQQSITVNTATCDAGLYGYYNFIDNTLTVCQGLSEKDTQETFSHELIHAVQDTADGIKNDTLTTLLSQSQRNQLRTTERGKWVQNILDENYPESRHEIEFEAWYFESYLSEVLFK